jgi:hypothetical protein
LTFLLPGLAVCIFQEYVFKINTFIKPNWSVLWAQCTEVEMAAKNCCTVSWTVINVCESQTGRLLACSLSQGHEPSRSCREGHTSLEEGVFGFRNLWQTKYTNLYKFVGLSYKNRFIHVSIWP